MSSSRNFNNVEEMNLHMDSEHSGRWKYGDPDVVFEGDDYNESDLDQKLLLKGVLIVMMKLQNPKVGKIDIVDVF